MNTALCARSHRPAGSPPRKPLRPRHFPPVPIAGMAWRLLGVTCFLALWQVSAGLVGSRAVLPGPVEAARAFITSALDDPGLRYLGVEQPAYLVNVGLTVGMALAAWAVGGVLGTLVGLGSARSQTVRNLSEPLLFVFGAVPALVLAPFMLVWFGQGWLGKAVLVAFYCFVTVGLVAQSAALALPRSSEEYAATLGLPAGARFWRVVVPASMPAVFAGLRIAMATAIAVQATVELLGSQTGAGRLIALRASQGNVAAVMGLSLAVGVAAVLLDVMFRVICKRLVRWQ